MASNGTAYGPDFLSTLEDDLVLEKTILKSLLDTPVTLELQRQIDEQRIKVANLQKRLGEARRGQSIGN
jgi:hypothetical protein